MALQNDRDEAAEPFRPGPDAGAPPDADGAATAREVVTPTGRCGECGAFQRFERSGTLLCTTGHLVELLVADSEARIRQRVARTLAPKSAEGVPWLAPGDLRVKPVNIAPPRRLRGMVTKPGTTPM